MPQCENTQQLRAQMYKSEEVIFRIPEVSPATEVRRKRKEKKRFVQ